MADDNDNDHDNGDDEGRRRRRRRPKVRELVSNAREQLEDLTGRRVSSVLGFESDGDSGWDMTLEVFELERIPETTSIMGCYRLKLDEDGDVVEYRRLRRYNRSRPDEDG
jgi:hypothetical protein